MNNPSQKQGILPCSYLASPPTPQEIFSMIYNKSCTVIKRLLIFCRCLFLLFYNILLLFSLKWVDDMADAGSDQYTFHIEATGNKYYGQLSLKQTPSGPVLSVCPREMFVL